MISSYVNRLSVFLSIKAVLSLENLVPSDFGKVAGTAIYYLQYYFM